MKVVDPIIKHIQQEVQGALSNHEISYNSPIPWAFRQLSNYECEKDENGFGVRATIWTNPPLYEDIKKVEQHASKELDKYINAASTKFLNYEDCVKILVIELCGDPYLVPDSTSFEKICNQASSLGMVDQIWLAEPGVNAGQTHLNLPKP